MDVLLPQPSSRAPTPAPEGARLITPELLKHPGIFRMGDVSQVVDGVVGSGFSALDAALQGGWPVARLTELLCDHAGVGELSLLLPTLPKFAATALTQSARSSQSQRSVRSAKQASAAHQLERNHRAIWISPITMPIGLPCVAYAPALAREGVDLRQIAFVTTTSSQQTLWAMEQALLSGATRCVFGWIGDHPHDFSLRRISLAARKSESLCFLMRPAAAAKRASPAELRIAITPAATTTSHGAINVMLLKRRGLLRETTLQLQTRELPCLGPNRAPIALPAKPLSPTIRVDRGAGSPMTLPLNSEVTSATSAANVRQRSFIIDR